MKADIASIRQNKAQRVQRAATFHEFIFSSIKENGMSISTRLDDMRLKSSACNETLYFRNECKELV